MLDTYKVKIDKNSIEWIDDKPDDFMKSSSLIGYVTIVDEEIETREIENSLIDFFKNSPMYNSGMNLERENDNGREVEL